MKFISEINYKSHCGSKNILVTIQTIEDRF